MADHVFEVTERELSLILQSLSAAQALLKSSPKTVVEVHALTERLMEEAAEQTVRLPPLVPRVTAKAENLSHLYPGESLISLCGYKRKQVALADTAQPRCYRCLQIMMTMEDIGIANDR